jgi:hypothetical protein
MAREAIEKKTATINMLINTELPLFRREFVEVHVFMISGYTLVLLLAKEAGMDTHCPAL